jgi:hypothetical protein
VRRAFEVLKLCDGPLMRRKSDLRRQSLETCVSNVGGMFIRENPTQLNSARVLELYALAGNLETRAGGASRPGHGLIASVLL